MRRTLTHLTVAVLVTAVMALPGAALATADGTPGISLRLGPALVTPDGAVVQIGLTVRCARDSGFYLGSITVIQAHAGRVTTGTDYSIQSKCDGSARLVRAAILPEGASDNGAVPWTTGEAAVDASGYTTDESYTVHGVVPVTAARVFPSAGPARLPARGRLLAGGAAAGTVVTVPCVAGRELSGGGVLAQVSEGVVHAADAIMDVDCGVSSTPTSRRLVFTAPSYVDWPSWRAGPAVLILNYLMDANYNQVYESLRLVSLRH